MTLIDKAEALEPCPFCGGEAETTLGPIPGKWGARCKECDVWRDDREATEAAAIAAWNRRTLPAALPARWVGVKPLIFSEFKEGGCIGRPHPFQYFITQAHNGRFLCHHDETWHETLEAAQAHAQVAYQSAAPAPTDAAQARNAALREAAEIALRHRSKVQINEELWHEGQDWAAERIAEAILALIGGSK